MGDDPKDVVRRDAVTNNRLKGMRMRDEFICPITYTLMREPTVACDGHTYEKAAIEKWMRSSNKSPRTGEVMETTLIPNLNLKKLIHDIVAEGGEGFYTKDITDSNRLLEFSREKILVLECLGPPESDWNQQSFEVRSNGVVGGRRSNLDEGNQQRDVMLFRDIMVSRRHFEITPSPDASSNTGFSYFIRDLGSAGGTYIRISTGKRKQLHPGMIILLGKHQFTVSSIDDNLYQEQSAAESGSVSGSNGSVGVASSASAAALSSHGSLARKSALASDMLRLVADAERIIDGLSSSRDNQSRDEHLSVQLQNLKLELDHLKHDEALLLPVDAKADEKGEGAVRSASTAALKTTAPASAHEFGFSAEDIALSDAKAAAAEADAALNATTLEAQAAEGADMLPEAKRDDRTMKRAASFAKRRCVLTCCAPDGSPLQGKSFTVTTAGGTLGRKQTNTIATLVRVKDPVSGDEKFASVDSAISSEHARIDFDTGEGSFYISDGVPPGRASTNGTWYRLSGPHQESPPHLLIAGTEVLIGNIRFLCKEMMTIAERNLEDKLR
eukprot:gene12592-9009_t